MPAVFKNALKMRLVPIVVMLITIVVSFDRTSLSSPCGDTNASTQIDIADAVYLIQYIFDDGPPPLDDSGGDLNCNGQMDITDAVYMINYIFAAGPAPCDGLMCSSGVLLTGDPQSTAVAALYGYGPIATDSSNADVTGLLKNRLSVVLNPAATVGEVNAAIEAIDARISWMLPDELSMTLNISPVESQLEADSIANLLLQSGAFLFAFPAYQAHALGSEQSLELPPSGESEILHLKKMRMPAAWNVRSLIEGNALGVTVFVPDTYYNSTPHPEISSQQFVFGSGERSLAPTVDGNHGFCVSGIIGANFDNINTTGVHPGPPAYLAIRSMMIGGLTFPEILANIYQNMPAGRFVLSTSLGYNVDLSTTGKVRRAIEALSWRNMVKSRQSDFIHISAAGNDGTNTDDSRYASLNSPFNIAAAFTTPFELYTSGPMDLIDSLGLLAYWNYYTAIDPDNSLPMNNLIMVGSSDALGNESSFSNRGSSVRVLGEGVSMPCVRNDPGSIDGGCANVGGHLVAHYDGTSFAAPQVAGLAAYLLSLDPDLDNWQIKEILFDAYVDSPNPGFVDAYLAVLAIDSYAGNTAIRHKLLDIVDANGLESPDGQFDEHDVQYFLTKFNEYEQLRAGVANAPEDYTRFDLNGDGFTGGVYSTKFDLDLNYPPGYSLLSTPSASGFIETNEMNANDMDVLCYYAHSALYTGSLADRDSLLVDCSCTTARNPQAQCGLWLMVTSFPDYLVTSASAMLSVRVGKLEGQDTLWQAGVGIQLVTTGGVPVAAQGNTDLNGFFNTSVSKDAQATSLNINISALEDTVLVATGSESAWLASAVVPTLQGGEFCAVGAECANPRVLAPLNLSVVGSYVACEGYANGAVVSGAIGCQSSFEFDPGTGSLQRYQFSINASGSPTVQVVHTTGETCLAEGSSSGGPLLRFTVTSGVQLIFSQQSSIANYPNSGQSFHLRRMNEPHLIDQNSSNPQNPLHDVSLSLLPGDYELWGSCGACCGEAAYLSCDIQFAPPVLAGAVKAGE